MALARWALGLIAVLWASGCGVLWGEPPVPPQAIQAPSGPSCPEITTALTEPLSQARDVLICWRTILLASLSQVKGAEPGRLSRAELSSLLRSRLLRLRGSFDEDSEVLDALLRLLGWSSVDASQVAEWFDYFYNNLIELRALYSYVRGGYGQARSYAGLTFSSLTLAGLIDRLPNQYHAKTLARDLRKVFDLGPWIESTLPWGVNAVRSLCPEIPTGLVLFPSRIAHCLKLIIAHHRAAAPWWDWRLGPQEALPDLLLLAQSRQDTISAAESWFANKSLPLSPLSTRDLLAWLGTLGISAPDDLRSSLSVLPRLGRKSNSEHLYAEDIPALLRTLDNSERLIDGVLPDYFRSLRLGLCQVPAVNWKQCSPSNLADYLTQDTWRVFNLSHSVDTHGAVVAAHGLRFAQVAVNWTLAQRVVTAFDGDGDGVLSARVNAPEHNEMAQMLTVMIRSGEMVSNFLANLNRRLRNLEGITYQPNAWIGGLNMVGLSRVVTLAGTHALVHRSRRHDPILFGLLSHLTSLFPGSSVHLDVAGVAGVLNAVQILPEYHRFVASRDSSSEKQIRLGQALARAFPRTSESCKEFGLGVECSAVWDRLMPPREVPLDSRPPEDMDPAVLTSLLIEGTIYHCDDDSDGKLGLSILDGDDELDCLYIRLKDLTQGLSQAGVLPMGPIGRNGLSVLLEFFNSFFLTRSFAKVALARGTVSWPILNPILLPFKHSATLGSVYSILNERLEKPPLPDSP